MTYSVDIIGDIHGQLSALEALRHELGYGSEWSHPDGRVPVFLGDLVDRGPDSLGVAELVMGLVQSRRALCLMGNHEYNLVAFDCGLSKPKSSNRPTIEDVKTRRDRWDPILAWFRTLPVALDLPELRVVHAVWHLPSIEAVGPVLGRAIVSPVGRGDAVSWLEGHVVLESPFDAAGLKQGLPKAADDSDDPHEVPIKGYEAEAPEPFVDVDGKTRTQTRVTWWKDPHSPVPSDKVTVFGHYWNLPPEPGINDAPVPPYASGTRALEEWQREVAARVSRSGARKLHPGDRAVCVDFNGVTAAGAGACTGAYRWPEHELAWARG